MFWLPCGPEHGPTPLSPPVSALLLTRQPMRDLSKGFQNLPKTFTLKKATAVCLLRQKTLTSYATYF